MLPQNHTALNNFFRNSFSNLYRNKSSRIVSSVFLEKCNEEPVITIPTDVVDLIGPPDPLSNLRPIIRRRGIVETTLQERLRHMQDAAHQWNQQFWSNHNTKFIKEKQAFIDGHQKLGEEPRQLTAEEMSEFYKKFLDEHWRTHVNYNFEWYKKNFSLLYLSLKVSIEKNLARIV